jgi:cell division protein FtsL
MNTAVARLFRVRVRGVSLVEALAFVCLAMLVISVYFFKANAGQESAKIKDLDREIQSEDREVRRLREQLTTLQQPARIERLSQQYLDLAPMSARQEASPEDLTEIARQGPPPPQRDFTKAGHAVAESAR